MVEYFAGGHLRFLEGAWRDDNGDVVDIVEVVRCKDCRYYEPHGNGKIGICMHKKLKRYLRHDTDFCSYGERREL